VDSHFLWSYKHVVIHRFTSKEINYYVYLKFKIYKCFLENTSTVMFSTKECSYIMMTYMSTKQNIKDIQNICYRSLNNRLCIYLRVLPTRHLTTVWKALIKIWLEVIANRHVESSCLMEKVFEAEGGFRPCFAYFQVSLWPMVYNLLEGGWVKWWVWVRNFWGRVNFMLPGWGRVSHLWLGFGKFLLKIPNFQFFSLRVGSKVGQPLIYCMPKVCSGRDRAHL